MVYGLIFCKNIFLLGLSLIIVFVLKDLEESRTRAMHEGAIDLEDMKLPLPGDDDEDIMQYKFPKFAATYFVGNTSHTYIRRALKVPLLPIKNEGDQLVRELEKIHLDNTYVVNFTCCSSSCNAFIAVFGMLYF